jgi:hypothetical protein
MIKAATMALALISAPAMAEQSPKPWPTDGYYRYGDQAKENDALPRSVTESSSFHPPYPNLPVIPTRDQIMRVCEINPRAGEDIATCFDNEVDAIVRLVGQHDWYRLPPEERRGCLIDAIEEEFEMGTFWRRVANCVASPMQLWKAANQSYAPTHDHDRVETRKGCVSSRATGAAFGRPFCLWLFPCVLSIDIAPA